MTSKCRHSTGDLLAATFVGEELLANRWLQMLLLFWLDVRILIIVYGLAENSLMFRGRMRFCQLAPPHKQKQYTSPATSDCNLFITMWPCFLTFQTYTLAWLATAMDYICINFCAYSPSILLVESRHPHIHTDRHTDTQSYKHNWSLYLTSRLTPAWEN